MSTPEYGISPNNALPSDRELPENVLPCPRCGDEDPEAGLHGPCTNCGYSEEQEDPDGRW